MHTQICDVGIRKTIALFNFLKRLTGNLSFVDYTSVENTVRRCLENLVFSIFSLADILFFLIYFLQKSRVVIKDMIRLYAPNYMVLY